MNLRVLGLATGLLACCTAGFADKVARPGITPVQAELITDVNAHLLKMGAPVFARVVADWDSKSCTLRTGAILKAHVISVVPHTKAVKGSELGLAFSEAQCGAPKLGAFELVLAALAAPPQAGDLGILSDPVPFSSRGEAGRGSMKAAAGASLQLQAAVYEFPMIPHMQMGQVYDIRGLKLSVGTGVENSSVLTSRDHDVTLEKHTLLLLVPAEGAFPRAVADDASRTGGAFVRTSAPSASGLAAPVAPPVDDAEICEPPDCNVVLPAGSSIDEGKPAARISIRALGYAPRPQRLMNRFDDDESLAYLGAKELLVGFNPHILAPRHTLGPSGPTLRVIRAALVDTETHRVVRTVDWELPDYKQYLWPLSGNRALVHVGSELRVYGEGLKILNRIALSGPLAFVRVTPDGNFMAIGVIHERHTPELHAQLHESMELDPEEDVSVQILNRSFETIGSSNARSGLMAPTLLNEGQANLLAQPNMRYRIAMRTWDNQVSTVARFTSSCKPELSSIAPDLLFLVSCDKRTDGREYRVLRSNGKVELKGAATPNECGHAAGGNAAPGAFVVKVVESNLPVAPEGSFSASEFTAEELRVYRATDGKRLLGVRIGSPSSSRDGYALAPDGTQLAILNRDEIAVYSVPEN